MPRKTKAQHERDRTKWLRYRQNLIKTSSVYREDFNKAYKGYLIQNYPGIDLEDCDLWMHPDEKENFVTGWSEEAYQLAEKWNLLHPWDPEGDEPPWPSNKPIGKIIARLKKQIDLEQIRNHHINLPPYSPSPNRFLLLEIDLHHTKKDIRTWFDHVLDHYWGFAGPPQELKLRGPEIEELPFKVYEMKESGKSLLEITYELFPELEGANPNYNPVAKQRYEEVRRAYQKAVRLSK